LNIFCKKIKNKPFKNKNKTVHMYFFFKLTMIKLTVVEF